MQQEWKRRGRKEKEMNVRKARKKETSRWVDNIKINVSEIGWASMDLIDVAQDRDQ
jgi:hypothetical protein